MRKQTSDPDVLGQTGWYLACCCQQQVKVRIKSVPQEPEIDGVRLDRFQPGSIREVSGSVGAWLIAQGYAEPEMRRSEELDDRFEFPALRRPRESAHDHPRRRRTDR